MNTLSLFDDHVTRSVGYITWVPPTSGVASSHPRSAGDRESILQWEQPECASSPIGDAIRDAIERTPVTVIDS